MRPQLSSDLIAIKRPHFEVRKGRLRSVASRTHLSVDARDEALWNALDGTSTIGQLRRSWRDVDSRLRRYRDVGACEVVPQRFPDDRRRILVLETHMDDAVLSVGGLMWSLREQCEFTVVSMIEHSNYTSSGYCEHDRFRVAQISELRKAESALVMRLLGGHHRTLGKADAPLRYQPGDWTPDWYRHHGRAVKAFIGHCANAQDIESWASSIEALLVATDAHEIWLPLGVGGHTDHELTRDAALRALSRLRGLERRSALFFYQDVPYSVRLPGHTDQIIEALTIAGATLDPRHEDIARVFADKLHLMSIYESQFQVGPMAEEVEEAARQASASGTGLAELRFAVIRMPGPVNPLAVYSGRPAVQRLESRLGPWYQRHRRARRIRLLLQVPVGRWAEDLSFLLDAFPEATLEVHICDAGAVETKRLASARIVGLPVTGTTHGWAVRLLRIALARRCPLIVATDHDRKGPWWLTKAISFLLGALWVGSINDFVLALRAVQARTAKSGPAPVHLPPQFSEA